MKTLAIAILALISLKASGQTPSAPSTRSGAGFGNILPIDSQTHKITYSEWVKVDGAKADDLYGKAVTWLTIRNDSVENAFTIVKDNGKISCKGFIWLTVESPIGTKYSDRELTRKLFYTISIGVKDGGYQFTMSDFYFHSFATSIFSSDKDSALESMYNRNLHDSLARRFFFKINSTEKLFSASLKGFMEPSTAKTTTPTGGVANSVSQDNLDERVAAAGVELIKAGNQYYTGLAFTLAGVLIEETGILVSGSSGVSTAGLQIVELGGGVLALVGTIDMIASYSHIKNAGRILKYGTKYEFGFGATNTGGVGLCLRF